VPASAGYHFLAQKPGYAATHRIPPGDTQYPTHRHESQYSSVFIDKAVLESDPLQSTARPFPEYPFLL